MALWTKWLSNKSPPYAAYQGLNACRQLATDKHTGLRPLECREVWMRLMAGCNVDQSSTQATIVCDNAQLCARLIAGIEDNLHTVPALWPQSTG